MDDWRILLYPLGFLPNILFGLRFLFQWIKSEKEGKSLVTPLFWQLSLLGNILLTLHGFIQIQYPICLVQSCNALISWRNLTLCHQKKSQVTKKTMLGFIFLMFMLVTLSFILQNYFLDNSNSWFRIPTAPWETEKKLSVSFWWHLFGYGGYILFSARFCIQWWQAENARKSYLSESFWWISILGALLILGYSFNIGDSVLAIPAAMGLIPYIRNIMLINKRRQPSFEEEPASKSAIP